MRRPVVDEAWYEDIREIYRNDLREMWDASIALECQSFAVLDERMIAAERAFVAVMREAAGR